MFYAYVFAHKMILMARKLNNVLIPQCFFFIVAQKKPYKTPLGVTFGRWNWPSGVLYLGRYYIFQHPLKLQVKMEEKGDNVWAKEIIISRGVIF
jgi:hypothetical protein